MSANDMDNITQKTIEFLKGLIAYNYDASFLDAISGVLKVDKTKINSAIMNQISNILNVEIKLWTVMQVGKKHVQEEKTTSLGEILLDISAEHHHNDGEHSCDFHTESLISHLFFAMFKTMEQFPSSMTFKQRVQNAVTALLHDVGKPACKSRLKFKEKKVIGFPFHGEMGSGILLKCWNYGFAPYFSKEEWEVMARTVAVHMCGYHETDLKGEQAVYKLPLLRFEQSDVKRALYWLSYGDTFGAVPDPSVAEPVVPFIKSRQPFLDDINGDFDLKAFKGSYKLRGTVIEMNGMSASGKSTVTKHLIDTLIANGVPKEAIVVVERDVITTDVTSRRLGLGPRTEKAIGEEYKKIYDAYTKMKLGKAVNLKMSKLIDDAVRKGKIVIVDTVANMFSGADFIYPDIVSDSFKIAIDVLRNSPMTNEGERLGCTLDKQLEIFGQLTPLCWLPVGCLPGPIGAGRLNHLASISSASSGCERICADKSKKVRPHFRFQKTWGSSTTDIDRMLGHIAATIEYDKDAVAEDEMDMCELFEHLTSICTWDQLRDWFGMRLFMTPPPALMQNTELEKRAFMIKYLDHSRLYRPKFARNGRGSVVLELDNNKFVCIKNQLQRGVEYLTHTHHDAGVVENEDVKEGQYDHLDDIQQEIMRKFAAREALDGFYSGKKDGSLSSWGLIPRDLMLYGINVYKIIRDLIENSTDERDEFSRMLIRKADEMNLPFIPLLAF